MPTVKQKTVILCGGGTAGHITPALYVANALKQQAPELKIVFILERGTRFRHLVDSSSAIDETFQVSAGKWRRYHGQTALARLLDIKTVMQNFGGLFKTSLGTISAIMYFLRRRPDIVFAKGGFVGVPVGIAARVCRVPLITHDSDHSPGLANRLISRWAVKRAVSSDNTARAYKYKRTIVVGIPVDDSFYPVPDNERKMIKKKLGVPDVARVVVIVGGSQGAQKLNQAIREVLLRIHTETDNLFCMWLVGERNESAETEWLKGQSKELQHAVLVRGYTTDMSDWFQISDLIISRGGATALAEIIASQKPSIVVPAAFLPGGHQTENAIHLASHGAIIYVPEQQNIAAYAAELAHHTTVVLTDQKMRSRMQQAIQQLPQHNAAKQLAEIILEEIHVSKTK